MCEKIQTKTKTCFPVIAPSYTFEDGNKDFPPEDTSSSAQYATHNMLYDLNVQNSLLNDAEHSSVMIFFLKDRRANRPLSP